jgi:lysozyme
MLKRHNAGDFTAAARAFAMWNKSNGQVMGGLIARRAEEAALYLTPVEEADPIAQSVDVEKPMTASTINKASVVAGGTASLAAVSQTLSAVNEVKYGIESLGSWVVPLLLVAVVGLCGFIIWQRWDMRQKGIV